MNVFTRDEHLARLSRVRKMAALRGFDALIIFDDDRFIGGGGVRYVSGYRNTTIPLMPSALVIPTRDDVEPTLCIVPGFSGCQLTQARLSSWISKVRATPLEMWGADVVKDITDSLMEAGISRGVVGIDGLPQMVPKLLEDLRKRIQNIEFVDATGLTERARLEKSDSEIQIIRKAVELTDLGLNTLMRCVRDGVMQCAAIAEAECAAKKMGAEEVLVPMSAGKPWIWGVYRGDRRFSHGDMIAAEFNARYMGYYGQICRTAVLGKPSQSQRDVYEATLEALRAMMKSVLPGVTASELFNIAMDVVKSWGYEYSGVRFGHGLGLTIAEGFNIVEDDDTRLMPSYYVMLHPNIVVPEEGVAAILGDPLIVTQKGCEVLSKVKYEIELANW